MSSKVITRGKSEFHFELYKIIMFLIFGFCLLLPIGKMLFSVTGDDIVRVFSSSTIL